MPTAPAGSAYCALSQDGCVVFAYSQQPIGIQSTLVIGPHPGYQYGIAQFIGMFPQAGFVCRAGCPGCGSSGSGSGSTTPPQLPPPPPPPPQPAQPAGPQEPPEEVPPTPPPETGPNPCAPSMSQRADHANLGFSTASHLAMTRGGALQGGRVGTPPAGMSRATWLATEPPLTLEPEYTRLPRIDVQGDPKEGQITVYHPPTGPGWMAFHSPDLNEFCLRGNGVHPEGKWPQRQSNQTLIIHSGASGVAGTDDADQRFGIGLPSARTINPRSGWYMRRNSSNVLSWTPTDANGVDSTGKQETFQLNGILYTASGRRLNSLRTSGDVTLTSANDVVFITGAHVVTLPPTPLAGDRFHIVNLTAANRTVARNGNSIDGAASDLTLPAGASVIMVQDKNGGTDWRIVAAYKLPGASGSVTFPLQAPDDGVANYAFDAGTTPGSENAGMGFTPADTGPTLFDVNGLPILVVSDSGVTINGKATITGFVDPTGYGFTPQGSRPGAATTLGNGLWAKDYTATNVQRVVHWYDGAFDQLLMAGGFTRVRSALTASATLTAQDMGALVPVTATVATITASLPAAASVPAGAAITFVRTDASGQVVTVARSGADTINSGAGAWTLNESQDTGTSRHAITFVSDGASNWTAISHAFNTAGGILKVIAGGTGLSSYTQGDLLYASAGDTLSKLAKDGNATRYLSNTGASNNPAWAQVNVANGVTGTLPLGNGGTGGTTADTANASLAGGTARSNNTSARHLGYDGTNGGYFTNTELFDNVQHLTQKTSVTDGFKFLVVDESGNSGYVNFEDIDPTGVKLIARTVSYSGSGSSGKTVTLTGINRAHAIFVKRDNSTSYGTQDFMLGATGAFNLRHVNDTGSYGCSLDAAAAGTSQTLTINSTNADVNSSGVTYKILVFGSSI